MESLRTFALVALIAFVLHGAWEVAHVGLYTGYEHWTLGLPVALVASIGDVLYTLGALALVSGFKGSLEWFVRTERRDYLMLVTLGFFVALLVEYKGLALDRWQYLPEMPIIPMLGVGISPLMQMALLLPLTVWIASRVMRRRGTLEV